MSTRTWVWGAVVVVVIGVGAWFWFGSGSGTFNMNTADQSATSTSSTTGTSSQVVSGAGTTSGSGTIGGLLALHEDLQCSVTLSTDGTQSEGMIYVSAEDQMHGDFSTTENGSEINSTTINDGTFIYSWSNLSTQGYKATVTGSGSTGVAAHGGVDNTTAINYSCKPWSLDASEFVPPANITF